MSCIGISLIKSDALEKTGRSIGADAAFVKAKELGYSSTNKVLACIFIKFYGNILNHLKIEIELFRAQKR